MIVIFLQNSYLWNSFLKTSFFWYNVKNNKRKYYETHYLKPSIPFGTASKHAFSRGKYPAPQAFLLGWIISCLRPATRRELGSSIRICPSFRVRLTPLAQPLDWRLLLAPSDTCHRPAGDNLFHRQSSMMRIKLFQPHYLKIFSLRYQIETQLTDCYGASIRLGKKSKSLSLTFTTQ